MSEKGIVVRRDAWESLQAERDQLCDQVHGLETFGRLQTELVDRYRAALEKVRDHPSIAADIATQALLDSTEAPDTEAHVRDGLVEYRPIGSDRGTTP